MGREGELPALRGRVVQHGRQRRLGQRRAEEQEERVHRVDDVDSGDAAVAEVLLGEQERLAVGVGRQLVGGEALAVGQRREAGVLLAAGLAQVGRQLLVERLAAPLQVRIILFSLSQQVGGRRPVAAPVGTQLAAEILDGVLVVVGQHQVARRRGRAHVAEVEDESGDGHVVAAGSAGRGRLVGRQLALADERLGAGAGAGVGGSNLVLRGGGVDVAPVDAQVVALLLEDRLVLRADAQDGETALVLPRPDDFLGRLVDRQVGAVAEIDGDGVVAAVHGAHVPGQIRQRPGQHVEVVGQGRRGEREGDFDPRPLEVVDRARRPDLEADLRQRRRLLRLVAHEPVGLAVDANQARQCLLLARPVAGGVVGQTVGARPDAEVGVAGDERDGRRPERRRRLGAAHAGRLQGRAGQQQGDGERQGPHGWVSGRVGASR